MATSLLQPQQSAPLAATLTDIYTVGVGTSAVISTLKVCNRSATATTFRIAVRPDGDAIANGHYQYYDVNIGGYDTFSATEGWTLTAGDVVSVYATDATLSFTLYGQEVTS